MTLLCIHLPRFELALARRDALQDGSEPAILADKRDRGRVLQVDSQAHERGARAGQSVLQACALVPGVRVFIHDALHAQAVWSDMLDALDALCPLVDDSGLGTAYLDMRGCAGTAQEWRRQALALLLHFELPVRTGCGENKFLARAAAHGGNFEDLPIELLGIEPRVLERLHLLGIQTLRELAQLPHGPFVRRFGKEAARWHEHARGIDRTPFRPRAQEMQIDAAFYGEGTATQSEAVLFALRMLADRVCGDLHRAGKGAVRLAVTFECENGEVQALETGFAQATADGRTMLDVLRAKLEAVTFTAPVLGLRMQVLELEEAGVAASLFAQSDPDPQAFAIAAARLRAVTGQVPQRARVRSAHRMEARFAFEPFSLLPASANGGAAASPTILPQLRLLAVREIAVRVRAGAPVRVGTRRVVESAGPWRVDEDWFDSPLQRDEYDVLLDDGMLCRIYRQGEHWYLRGAYD